MPLSRKKLSQKLENSENKLKSEKKTSIER